MFSTKSAGTLKLTRKLASVSVLLVALSLSAVFARQSGVALLPPLLPSVSVSAIPDPRPSASWQVHQSLDVTPGSWNTRLSLSPTVNLVLHDPEAALTAEVRAQELKLRVLDDSSTAAREALVVHQNFLSLQSSLWFQDFLSEWLDQWHALPPADGLFSSQAQSQRSEVELMLHETSDSIDLLLLKLSPAGISVTQPASSWFRPHVPLPAEPLAACLSGSPEIRRLELLQGLQHLDHARQEAGRQQKVELELGANVAVSGQTSPQFGWNVGLRVGRADHTGPQLRFESSSNNLSQSLTLRPSVAAPELSVPDLDAAYDQEAIRLVEILQLAGQAAHQEQAYRQTANLDLEHFSELLDRGAADRGDLQTPLESAIKLSQAVSYHDWMLLTLAVECRLTSDYRQTATYP